MSEIEESLELSALLTQAITLTTALHDKLNDSDLRWAYACARNAVQALMTCEDALKRGVGADQ